MWAPFILQGSRIMTLHAVVYHPACTLFRESVELNGLKLIKILDQLMNILFKGWLSHSHRLEITGHNKKTSKQKDEMIEK